MLYSYIDKYSCPWTNQYSSILSMFPYFDRKTYEIEHIVTLLIIHNFPINLFANPVDSGSTIHIVLLVQIRALDHSFCVFISSILWDKRQRIRSCSLYKCTYTIRCNGQNRLSELFNWKLHVIVARRSHPERAPVNGLYALRNCWN